MEMEKDQIDQVLRESTSRGKIAGIKKYMDLTGDSLRDAKLAVEQLLNTGVADGQTESIDRNSGLDGPAMDAILDAIQDGSKVLAVKHYRDATGKSLRESKIYVEEIMAELEVADPDAVGKSGCSAVLLVAIGVICFVISQSV